MAVAVRERDAGKVVGMVELTCMHACMTHAYVQNENKSQSS